MYFYWNPVFEKMGRRLARSKRLYLSWGGGGVGEVTLIKSTLSTSPTHFLSLLPILVKVANRMEKIQRDFLWSGVDAPKVPLVEWSKVCMPVQNGGLGIWWLRRFNSALLGKWLWRYGMERDSLWRKVIEAKYKVEGAGWCTEPVLGTYGVSVWKSIRHSWLDFSKFLQFDVGDGTRIKFWADVC